MRIVTSVLAGLALACAVISADTREAAACSTDGSAKARAAAAPDVFTWFDTAAAVGEVTITASPGFTVEGHGKAGDVTLKLGATLKGTPAKTTTFHVDMTLCTGHSKGAVMIAFFDAKGTVIGMGARATKAALAKWKVATTVAAQRTLLEGLVKSKDPVIAGAATKKLATLPAVPAWSVAPAKWKAPGTAAAAVTHVRGMWPALTQALPGIGKFDVTQGCKLEALKQDCSAHQVRMRDVLGPKAQPDLGTIDALASGSCWIASCSVGFYMVSVYVDADDGRVLGAWIPPEG